jgi:hypothetical protein
MIIVNTRINVARDETLSGPASGLPPGDHDAEIVVVRSGDRSARRDRRNLPPRVSAIQAELAALPVRDRRSPDEIIGYNERGHFD